MIWLPDGKGLRARPRRRPGEVDVEKRGTDQLSTSRLWGLQEVWGQMIALPSGGSGEGFFGGWGVKRRIHLADVGEPRSASPRRR